MVGIDEIDHLVGVGLRGVIALRQALQIAAVLRVRGLGRVGREIPHVPIAARAVEQGEIALEPARGGNLVGLLAHVPFAHHVGVVAAVLQQLRERRHAVVQIAFIAGLAHLVRGGPFIHVAHAVDMRVRAAQQHGARGRTTGVGIELVEPHAVFGQGIEVRRPDLAAEATQIRKSQVVAQDDHDVRRPRRGRGGGRGGRRGLRGQYRRPQRRRHADDPRNPENPAQAVYGCDFHGLSFPLMCLSNSCRHYACASAWLMAQPMASSSAWSSTGLRK